MEKIVMQVGKTLDIENGMIIDGEDTVMSSVLFYYVNQNTIIHLKDKAYAYTYAFYTTRWQEEYIYSYAYQKEQNWSDYARQLSGLDSYLTEDSRFEREGYIRISIKKRDGSHLSHTICYEADEIIEVLQAPKEDNRYLKRHEVQREIDQCIRAVKQYQNDDTLTFTLLTDSHVTVNGTWKDTIATIGAVEKEVKADALIHLGDLEDGTLSKEYCRHYANIVLDDLKAVSGKVYLTVGNHDTNYFRGNPDLLSEEEIYTYYLEGIEAKGKRRNQLWYYEDFEKHRLRIYFLHSYDFREQLRYGYSMEEIEWLMDNLDALPDEYGVILFSHDAPIERLDYWAKEIRNGERMLSKLEEWHRSNNNRILAFIHGHTHADYIYQERAFPIISIGCSKCEYFPDKKPEGATAYRRIRNTVTQELWDTLLVNTKERSLRLIRFGAGMDRELIDGKLIREQENLLESRKETKIWAHRGASGYAPENTMEAFQMAIELGADGIELDVQFTKDRQLVVIHDERIDRVSDGHGRVVDYTLEELRRFTFNKTHPEYKGCSIPTLEEVLTLIKPTDMTVNIELKTGVNFYDGIEDRVLRLVERLGMQEQVIYSSFNHYSVRKVKELCPDAHVGFLYCDGTLHMAEYAKTYQGSLHPSLSNMQYIDLVPDCKEKGIALHVWTVNDRSDMEHMAKLGVDAIITNYPDVAYEVLRGKKAPVSELRTNMERKTQEEKERETARQKAEQERTDKADEKRKIKNPILHGLGAGYSKVRKVCVKIDQWVQRAAGKQ